MSVPEVFEFRPFRLDVKARALTRDGEPISLTPKAFDTLVALVRNHGEILRKQVLIDTVWHDAFVEDAVLTQNVYTLRRALNDTDSSQRLIATVPRIGYRFIAPVREVSREEPGEQRFPRSIAVLPFDVLGADAEKDWLGVGLADALITRLSGFRTLTVRPTSAVLRLQGLRDAAQVADRLGVEGVLEGRVQMRGGRLRATIQLVNLAQNRPSWGSQFETDAGDLFVAQDALAAHVARELNLTLTEPDYGTVGSGRSDAAYRDYIKGRYFWSQRHPDALRKCIDCFRRAIELEPDWALPRAGIADGYALQPLYGNQAAGQAFAQAEEQARKAVELEPGLAEAHASLGYVQFIHHWDPAAAESSLRHALELKPTYATAHQWYGFLLASGSRFEAAIEHSTRAVELAPLTPIVSADLAWVLYTARHYREAVERFEATLDLDERFAYARTGLALALLQLGHIDKAEAAARRAAGESGAETFARAVHAHCLGRSGRIEEAEALLEELKKPASGGRVPSSRIALALCGLSRPDEALDALERAVEDRSRFIVFLRTWPVYDSVRGSSRFRTLLDRTGI